MNNNKNKGISIVGAIIIVIIIFAFIGSFMPESQYAKDSKSWQDKSYSEMSEGEKEAMNDYLEWSFSEDNK